MTKLHTKNKLTSRRGVAPVIATLLLVAIAVVGGSIVFVFSQGFFSSAQISGSPNIESIKILGYDATDGNATQFHDGFSLNSTSTLTTGETGSDGLNANEYVAVYLKNDSVNKVTFSEIRLAGEVYTYVYNAKTPKLKYDQHPLVAVSNVYQWGFSGLNFHWNKVRNYTWNEIPGRLHLVRASELQSLLDIPYAYYLTNL